MYLATPTQNFLLIAYPTMSMYLRSLKKYQSSWSTLMTIRITLIKKLSPVMQPIPASSRHWLHAQMASYNAMGPFQQNRLTIITIKQSQRKTPIWKAQGWSSVQVVEISFPLQKIQYLRINEHITKISVLLSVSVSAWDTVLYFGCQLSSWLYAQ